MARRNVLTAFCFVLLCVVAIRALRIPNNEDIFTRRNPVERFNAIRFNTDSSHLGPNNNMKLVAEPTFRETNSRRNLFAPSAHSSQQLPGSGHFHGPQNPAQHSGIAFNNNRGRNAPISFGNSAGVPISNKNKVVTSTDTTFFETNPTLPGLSSSSQSSSSVVFFPGSTNIPGVQFNNEDNNNEDNNIFNNDECDLRERTVNFNGECSILLHKGSCPDNHWLILSEDGIPYCSDRKCPWDSLYFHGDCVDPGDFELCRQGQMLYVDFQGNVDCDCEPDYVYDPNSMNCYTKHEQGHCTHNYYIEFNEDQEVSCVPNPCFSDIFVLHQKQCHKKNYLGYCDPSEVHILSDETADCLFIVPHSIFEIPTLNACPPGSKRDFYHKCRAVYRVPSLSTSRSLKGDCRAGFRKDRRGTCRKVVSLFSG